MPIAANVVQVLLNAARTYMNIRKVTVNWWHSIDTSTNRRDRNAKTNRYYLMKNVSSRNFYASLIDDVARRYSSTVKYSRFDQFVNNDANSKKVLEGPSASDDHIVSGQIMEYENMKDYVQHLYDKWKETVDGNEITYNIYTCHYVCHSNWASSRSRR